MKMNVNERWEQGIPHDPRSERLAKELSRIDSDNGDFFDFRFGGDGDNGEELMYLLDIYFEEIDDVETRTPTAEVARLTKENERLSRALRSPVERGEGEEMALAAVRAERDFIKRECWGLGPDRSGENRLCGEAGEYCQTCTEIRREIAKMKDRALASPPAPVEKRVSCPVCGGMPMKLPDSVS